MQQSSAQSSNNASTVVEMELKDPGYDDDLDWWKEEYDEWA